MKFRIIILALFALILAAGLWLASSRKETKEAPPFATSEVPAAGSQTPPASVESRPEAQHAPGAPFATPIVDPSMPPIESIINDQVDYAQRVAALRGITTNLSDSDQRMLQNFLLRKGSGDDQQLGQAFKNQLLNVLCALDPPPSWLQETMQEMYSGANQSPVIRDYALQHLAAFYEQMESASNADAKDRSAIEETLWKALQETDSSIGGTALLSLTRLSGTRPERFDRSRIAEAAVRIAGDPAASELSRITALQVCGSLNVRDALPLVLQTAERGDNIPVRISAIGVLGIMGGSGVKELLTRIIDGTEERLIPPAQSALDQINRREEQAGTMNSKS